ncbi:MAG: hypothetical protein M1828_005986 [Chrysothrix sp. TS-e1954]|nr:MAG: hypothetical protein M1828_005986 [Chrysothrix sp. TS-e1954]
MFERSTALTTGYATARSFDELLNLLNFILRNAPAWSDFEQGTAMIGCPMTVVFLSACQSEAGFAFFQDPQANGCLKKVMNAWGQYLTSPNSASVLNETSSGWFGPTARHNLTMEANASAATTLAFEDIYECNSAAPHYGFNSWDDFFTRRFCHGVRPVAAPDDDSIITNVCESRTYRVARNIQARDRFWLKHHPYSVLDMLAFDELAHHFIGGTVYQAYLSALSYHRWHSPVSGTIRKAYVKDGTYFSKPVSDTWVLDSVYEATEHDTWEGFTAATATRAIIFIEADNRDIGLMCVMPIGMVEVSTCEITATEGQHVEKGEELGMFHYGGSSHCVMFREGVTVKDFPDVRRKHNVPVRGKLAEICASAPPCDDT